MARAYYNEFDANAAAWLRELIKDGLIADGDVDERSIVDVQPSDLEGYTQCHFFAGIGGWSAALRLAGWPEDERVWTGSCPCQPFSSAGKRKGTDDERHLWPTFFRLIEACQPPIVFGEQVASSEVVGTQLEAAFVAAVQAGDFAAANRAANRLVKTATLDESLRWVDGVFADMEAADYSVWLAVLGAHSVGAPHIRQRLYWGAARLADAGHSKSRGRHSGAGGLDTAKRAQQGVDTSANGVDDCGLGDTTSERFREAGSPFGSEGQSAGVPSCANAIGGLEHSPRNGRQQRGAESNGWGVASGCCSVCCDAIGGSGPPCQSCGLGNTNGERKGSERGIPEGQGTERSRGNDGLGDSNDSRPQGWFAVRQRDGELSSGATGLGHWSDYRIIHCRDGKARRIPQTQSGFQSVVDGLSAGMDGVRLACLDRFPLAGKIPNRVMLLRGAGNAIVPQVAAEFVRAFVESVYGG